MEAATERGRRRRTLRVGLAQIKPALGDVGRNLERVIEASEELAARGAELIVFPELVLTGYLLRDMVPEVAVRDDEEPIRRLCQLSERLGVALLVGYVEEGFPHFQFNNTAACFYGGKLLFKHHKVYLPTYGMFDECRYLARGHRFRAFRTPWDVAVGVLICEDCWHISSGYILSQDGAHLFIHIAASPMRGVMHPGRPDIVRFWDSLNGIYAQLFGAYVVFVNRVGVEDGISFWGGSSIFDPSGQKVCGCCLFDEALEVCELDLGMLRRTQTYMPLLRDERFGLVLSELMRIDRQRYESEGG